MSYTSDSYIYLFSCAHHFKTCHKSDIKDGIKTNDTIFCCLFVECVEKTFFLWVRLTIIKQDSEDESTPPPHSSGESERHSESVYLWCACLHPLTCTLLCCCIQPKPSIFIISLEYCISYAIEYSNWRTDWLQAAWLTMCTYTGEIPIRYWLCLFWLDARQREQTAHHITSSER